MHGQTGPLTVEGRGFPRSQVWMPNWKFDIVCVSAEVALELAEACRVDLRDVHRPRDGATGFKQILPRQGVEAWYEPILLAKAVTVRHAEFEGDRTGGTCTSCGRWRWLPVAEGDVPVELAALPDCSDVVASPEIFGGGMSAFRHLLFRRHCAELLVAANPRSWSIVTVPMAST